MASLALELSGITKRFGSTTAVDDVSLGIREGEVHALLGENGAGKTTLMNVAAGILRMDAGAIRVRGEEVPIESPDDAARCGIGMVHQHHGLISRMTVAENLHLGWKDVPALISPSVLQTRAAALSKRWELSVNPAARVSQLSTGERQRVAILRTLVRGARITILDEPTALLTPQETRELLARLRSMASEGHTIVFISHKLAEVMEVADRISILRRGRRLDTLENGECDVGSLAKLMVGRELKGIAVERSAHSGGPATPALVVDGVSCAADETTPGLHDVSFSVHAGEIFGVAGVSGNGQMALAEMITGLSRPTAGTIAVTGKRVASASDFIGEGVGHITDDVNVGMAVGATVEANAVTKELHRRSARRGPLLRRAYLRAYVTRVLELAGLADIGATRQVVTLSGGQIQRLMAHRELLAATKVLIAVHPSRGLDVAATEQVHSALLKACQGGAGVVLISEDLDEVLMLSDRVSVMYGGRLAGPFNRGSVDRDDIGLLMGGSTHSVERPDPTAEDRTEAVR